MTDDELETLFYLAMEFWARMEPIPNDIFQKIKDAPDEQIKRVKEKIYVKLDLL